MITGDHHRGYLPHKKVEGAIYFVTFRLQDALPVDVVARLVERRRLLLLEAERVENRQGSFHGNRSMPWKEYAEEVDGILDKHLGSSWLRRDDVAGLVADAIRFFDGKRYLLHAWVVMPTHVHVVAEPLGDHTLSAILHSWKSFTAGRANKLIGRMGDGFWQSESYDHWIRGEEEFSALVRYTVENPVKAGLCNSPEKWRWSSAWRGATRLS